jgi:Ca2+/Na+ antiporter
MASTRWIVAPVTVLTPKAQARSVTLVVLVILAVVWAIYLVSWLRSRSETRSVNSISSFSRHLSVLERTAPGTRQGADFGAARSRAGLAPSATGVVVRRPTLSPAKKRRRDILFGLAAATAVTALGAWLMGGVFSLLFVVALGLTVAYVFLLAQTQRRAMEAREKVRYLDGPDRWAAGGSWTDEADGTYGSAGLPTAEPGLRYATVRR